MLSSEPQGLRVIVSGASGGIGSAIVEHLVYAGCSVAALDVTFDGWRFNESSAVSRHRLDLRDWDAVQGVVDRAVQSIGGCDAVVANAAIVDTLHRAERFPKEEWAADVEVNLTGAYRLVQSAFGAMREAGKGRVVFVSSVAAMLGQPAQVAYAASKAGLIGVARTLAVEWAPHGITSNVVVPGVIETPKAGRLSAKIRSQYLERIPLARTGLSEEVAGTIAFLLSPAAAYVNGATIRVDGGFGLNGIALTAT